MSTNGTITGLPPDVIAGLMAKGRTRNAYGPRVIEFCESDEAAINPADVWPLEFGGKVASTLYQGFNTAIDKAGLKDTILVKKVEDSVFLLHKDRVHVLMQAQADAANEPDTE